MSRANYENFQEASTYSTTEKKVGTWIDGKPLYRKVIETTLPTVITDKTPVLANTALNIDNPDIIFIEAGYIVNTNSYDFYPFEHAIGDGYFYAAFIQQKANLRVSNNRLTYSGFPIVVSVLYTKTTD